MNTKAEKEIAYKNDLSKINTLTTIINISHICTDSCQKVNLSVSF